MEGSPFFLDRISVLHSEHASPDQLDHYIGGPNDLDPGAPESRGSERSIERAVVVNRYGVAPMHGYRKRRALAGTKTNAWSQTEKQFHLMRVGYRTGFQVSGSNVCNDNCDGWLATIRLSGL